MRKITGFINWKSCSPDILSINFSFFKLKKIYTITPYKQINGLEIVSVSSNSIEPSKDSNWLQDEKIKFKFCEVEILTLFCSRETVDVVQSVRTSDCGSEGRGFEPHLPPHQ
jgi:hypothetical protein